MGPLLGIDGIVTAAVHVATLADAGPSDAGRAWTFAGTIRVGSRC